MAGWWQKLWGRQGPSPEEGAQAALDAARDASLAAITEALDAVRAALRQYAQLETRAGELLPQIAFWEERRARAAEAGAAALTQEAEARRATLEAQHAALLDALDAARPAYQQATELLARVHQHQVEVEALHGRLTAQRAAAEATLTLLDETDASGRSGLDRLRYLETTIQEQLARAAAVREIEDL